MKSLLICCFVLVFCFYFVFSRVNLDAACDDPDISDSIRPRQITSQSIRVLMFRNGGNNSGETGLWATVDLADVPSYENWNDDRFGVLLNLTRDNLYSQFPHRLNQQFDLYDFYGNLKVSRSQLTNGSMYYLVPKGEHFYWPGMYVGHKMLREDIPVEDPTKPIVMHTLSLKPRLFHVPGFLSETEVETILTLAKGKMKRSVVVSAHGDVEDSARTSSNGWLYRKDGDDVLKLNQKCGLLAHVDVSLDLEEAVQVVHYGPGQKYESHYDWFEERHFANDPNWRAGVNRMITIFFYMNNVTEGGWTVFPRGGEDGYKDGEPVNWKDCTRGIKVQPRRGDAIMWYSLSVDGQMKGEGDTFSLHAGCPPLAGEKWAANKWIYNKKKITGDTFFA